LIGRVRASRKKARRSWGGSQFQGASGIAPPTTRRSRAVNTPRSSPARKCPRSGRVRNCSVLIPTTSCGLGIHLTSSLNMRQSNHCHRTVNDRFPNSDAGAAGIADSPRMGFQLFRRRPGEALTSQRFGPVRFPSHLSRARTSLFAALIGGVMRFVKVAILSVSVWRWGAAVSKSNKGSPERIRRHVRNRTNTGLRRNWRWWQQRSRCSVTSADAPPCRLGRSAGKRCAPEETDTAGS